MCPAEPRPPRVRAIAVQMTLHVVTADDRLTSAEVAHALTRAHHHVADDLTGLVTYGARRCVWKPIVRVSEILVSD